MSNSKWHSQVTKFDKGFSVVTRNRAMARAAAEDRRERNSANARIGHDNKIKKVLHYQGKHTMVGQTEQVFNLYYA